MCMRESTGMWRRFEAVVASNLRHHRAHKQRGSASASIPFGLGLGRPAGLRVQVHLRIGLVIRFVVRLEDIGSSSGGAQPIESERGERQPAQRTKRTDSRRIEQPRVCHVESRQRGQARRLSEQGGTGG